MSGVETSFTSSVELSRANIEKSRDVGSVVVLVCDLATLIDGLLWQSNDPKTRIERLQYVLGCYGRG